MTRRDLLKFTALGLARNGIVPFPLNGQSSLVVPSAGKVDYTLRIAPVTVELDRSRIVSTIGYNGTAPGPVLRMREGKRVTVEVINDTDTPELVPCQ